MSRVCLVSGNRVRSGVSLSDFLEARPTGLTECEAWAILCQAVQALQDLFLSNGAANGLCIPLVTPSTALLSSRGRVKLYQNPILLGCGPPAHLMGYLAPEYRPNKQCSDTENEKMWIYGLGETLKRATLTSHAATSRLSGELCQVFTDMTKPQASARASLMHLLDVISDYSKKRQQTKPFSHIVMDLHQEAMAQLETVFENPWGVQAMPEIRPKPINRCDTVGAENANVLNVPRLCWMGLNRSKPITREASTSMEDLSTDSQLLFTPGSVMRPKSICFPFESDPFRKYGISDLCRRSSGEGLYEDIIPPTTINNDGILSSNLYQNDGVGKRKTLSRTNNLEHGNKRKGKVRRNPINRAASRLYRAGDVPKGCLSLKKDSDCVGPEFVVRANLPSVDLVFSDCKGSVRKTVTVIMLNGQKVNIVCNPNTTTAGQLFEFIIQKQHIEENFMLGLSALIAGDFVFLPSDARICKAMVQGNAQSTLTLFVRVRFFLPNLKGIQGFPTRHLLYLQLRRSILEHQLPCNYCQLIDLGGMALQAEFGDFIEKEHGARDYFLLEHYVPETVSYGTDESKKIRQDLTRAHIGRKGLTTEKAEEAFTAVALSLPQYGGHFYTALWVLKDSSRREVWLYISAQGINLYERNITSHQWNPTLLEMFEWKTIQTLCYSKHYLCILPHSAKTHKLKLKKYKLKMDHKKSYFAFRLASLHHQFFLRLRTQYGSLNTLSEQFGIPLKDMKNETNSLYKLEALSNCQRSDLDSATVNAETEFKIEFCATPKLTAKQVFDNKCKRSKSISDFGALGDGLMMEEYQNKENEKPKHFAMERKPYDGLILDSSYLAGLPSNSIVWDKRRGVKMGTRAFSNMNRVSRSMEAVNDYISDDLEQLSLQSTSLHCSFTSVSRSPVTEYREPQDAYILDSSIKSCGNQFMPDFQETLSETFLEKLNKFSFAEERTLHVVSIQRNSNGSLGLQIMEGTDGKVYIQSVIDGGPADIQGNIEIGDQIVAVNGRNLLSMRYADALELLKNSGHTVEFVLSHASVNKNDFHAKATLPMQDNKITSRLQVDLSNINESHSRSLHERKLNRLKRISYPNTSYHFTPSPVEKHVTESCHDITNPRKFGSNLQIDVPYHKHIRYDLDTEFLNNRSNLDKTMSQSCTQIQNSKRKGDRAVIVDMIPKVNSNFKFYDLIKPDYSGDCDDNLDKDDFDVPHIPLPRCLGLSRKWRGPVRYPVTPIKKPVESNDESSNYVTTSDEEQIFIYYLNLLKMSSKWTSESEFKPPPCPTRKQAVKPALFGAKHKEIATMFLPSAVRFGIASALLLVYITEFRTVLQYLPFYNGKYPKN